MQIFLTTLNTGTYTFSDLGNYTVVHPIGPIPLLEPEGEFSIEDIQLSENLFNEVSNSNISLTNSIGQSITNATEIANNPPGFGIYAWANIEESGTLIDGLGLRVRLISTGIYEYGFDTPVSSGSYAVFTQAVGFAQQDVEAEVYSKTSTGFRVRINQQDDGGNTGVNVNYQHSITVIGPNNGLPAGPANTINITPLANPKSTINLNPADFTIADNGLNQADISVIDKTIFSIIRLESTGADQASNYNTTTIQPLVLTGTVTNFGTAAVDFTNNNGTVTCNFDGAVKVKYAMPHFTAGARESMKTTIQLNNNDYSAAAYGYIRDAQGHRRDNNTGEDVILVNNGDIIRVGVVKAENSTAVAAVTLETRCTIIIERIN